MLKLSPIPKVFLSFDKDTCKHSEDPIFIKELKMKKNDINSRLSFLFSDKFKNPLQFGIPTQKDVAKPHKKLNLSNPRQKKLILKSSSDKMILSVIMKNKAKFQEYMSTIEVATPLTIKTKSQFKSELIYSRNHKRNISYDNRQRSSSYTNTLYKTSKGKIGSFDMTNATSKENSRKVSFKYKTINLTKKPKNLFLSSSSKLNTFLERSHTIRKETRQSNKARSILDTIAVNLKNRYN